MIVKILRPAKDQTQQQVSIGINSGYAYFSKLAYHRRSHSGRNHLHSLRLTIQTSSHDQERMECCLLSQ